MLNLKYNCYSVGIINRWMGSKVYQTYASKYPDLNLAVAQSETEKLRFDLVEAARESVVSIHC